MKRMKMVVSGSSGLVGFLHSPGSGAEFSFHSVTSASSITSVFDDREPKLWLMRP
jgi:hypothetical protein